MIVIIANREKHMAPRDLIMHHVLCLMSGLVDLLSNSYIGLGVTLLVIELHSMILHTRTLFKMYTCGKTNIASQVLKYVNLITFIFIRFGIMFYIFYALHRDYASRKRFMFRNMSMHIYIFMSLGLTCIFLLSCVLFKRVVEIDFISKKDTKMINHDP